MSLTPEEETKLLNYFTERGIPKDQQARIRQIAEMSKDDFRLKDIKRAVRGSQDFVSGNRTKLRRRGVW